MVSTKADLLCLENLIAFMGCGIEQVVDVQRVIVALPLLGHFNAQVVVNRLTVVGHFSFLFFLLISVRLWINVGSQTKLGGAP